ncbi:hypothetical protein BUALT_Bualt03G0128700 [Buddleja alternifolia]|uniref:Uncharacterized protein n=1 Tax=Buddleja alternifolia TaxID=168488 RepID=A0AAV6Y438_9LAMI|nr:hypothetical protein BUALT_Bualt03G0128700 [Buddleja alternifolia]
MATSVVMAGSSTDHHNTNPSSLPLLEDHQPIRRSSGRRKSKGSDSPSGGQTKKNKQPQRGMGVEKLERLRQQERWKKMTEINPSFADHPTLMNPSHVNPVHQFSKLGGFGAPSVQMGFNQSYSGYHHGQMGYGNGCLNNNMGSSTTFRGKINGICSKEMISSSTANVVKCYSDHCNACHKKKRVNGENLGCGRVRSDMYREMSNVNGGYGFLGLNVGDINQNIMISHENQGFIGTKLPLVPPPQLGYAAVPNGKTGVEVVGVHKKGSERESSVLMEYEFFPGGKSGGDHSQNDDDQSVMMKKVMEGSSSSSASCIDLSLKLSY